MPGVVPAATMGTGYQAHMMVLGPGGYRFTDFLRVATPPNLLMRAAAIILIPMFWPFHISSPSENAREARK